MKVDTIPSNIQIAGLVIGGVVFALLVGPSLGKILTVTGALMILLWLFIS